MWLRLRLWLCCLAAAANPLGNRTEAEATSKFELRKLLLEILKSNVLIKS
jgi:hypothetical protein